jgi:CheY-like chemotaxis protein
MQAERDHSPGENARTLLPNRNSGLHILVVEDDRDTAESTALLLRYDGHRVEIALDGPSACQAARNKTPDVVLLDIALPGMDGWEVAGRLQKSSWLKKPFVIAVTGYGREEDRGRSLEAGIDLHLVKPVDPDFLRRLLARFYRILMPAVTSSAAGTSGKNREPARFPVALRAE